MLTTCLQSSQRLPHRFCHQNFLWIFLRGFPLHENNPHFRLWMCVCFAQWVCRTLGRVCVGKTIKGLRTPHLKIKRAIYPGRARKGRHQLTRLPSIQLQLAVRLAQLGRSDFITVVSCYYNVFPSRYSRWGGWKKSVVGHSRATVCQR